jgi:hypothetical protein
MAASEQTVELVSRKEIGLLQIALIWVLGSNGTGNRLQAASSLHISSFNT